ncbi:DUF982 domain-containing protein [Mesorhizobium sp. CAU 1741]|uniref:DUF982 domain-containing protein n=1 Tax=Mesorhizobium sp. CAU 1741 TaxID=3140366 RepID=UPI00325C2FD7
MNGTEFHQPIHVVGDAGDLQISTAGEAYAVLTEKWPPSRGKWYHAAARACRSASNGESSPHIARRMFLHAASEARIDVR